MKKYIYYIILAVATCLLHSCQEDSFTMAAGSFNIILMDESAEVQKRSLPADLSDELKKQFIICIENEDGKKAYNGNLGAYQTNAPALKPGQYSLQATYGENKALAIDEPYYISAKENATIEANQTTDITLVCSVGNALASFAFSDPEKPAEIFTSYTFVTTVNGESVSCTADDGRNPYFREGATVDFYLQGTTTDNKQINYKFASISSATRQTNYKYTLTIGATAEGYADLDISVNTTVSSITINETLPEEWLPKAKLSADGFDETNTLNYRETTDASTTRINYQAVKPVEDIEFTLNLEDQNLQSLNKTYLLSELTEEERQELVAAGITLPELNSNAGSIELTGMTNKFLCANDGSAAVNRIDVRIKANNRWSDTGTYTINTLRPEFNIAVNENDFWSKEFAIREFNITEGNAERVKAQTIYQYSTDGGGSWTTLNEDMKQKFSTHPEIKNYTVRALYRNALASNIADVTLETPTQLPNSSMDEWTDEIYNSEYYCFYPWVTKNSCHWDTNNSWTTRHRWNTIGRAHYNGFHAVSYVPGRSGLAAELRSTGNGRGNTKFINIQVKDYNKVAGQLFTGTAECIKGGTDAVPKDELKIYKDAQFSVRPTAIKFWYKYTPSGSDTWTAHMELLDGNNEIISQADYSNSNPTNDWTEVTLTLPFQDGKDYNKATYIYVIFNSTNNPGSNMSYTKQTYTFYINQGTETKSFSDALVGSILTIDDISLIYDR